MARKKDRLQLTLEALAELEGRLPTAAAHSQIAKAFKNGHYMVVAKAAKIVGEWAESQYLAEMERLYFACMDGDPVKKDPGCVAKLAIVKAINKMELDGEDIWLRGVHYRQLEPYWGGSEDTAAALRGECISGLISSGHRDSLYLGAPLLVDDHVETRYLAATAFGNTGSQSAELMLRLKVHAGDEDPRVMGACFQSLLQLDLQKSLDLISSYLDQTDPELCEVAAIALGESRHEAAFRRLQTFFEACFSKDIRTMLILPIGLVRNEEAVAFLLDLLGHEDMDFARAAVKALAIYRMDEHVRDQVEAKIAATRDPELRYTYREHFS